MSSRHAEASLRIVAEVREYEKGLAKVPGITEREIKEASKKFEAEQKRMYKAAVKEAEKAAKAQGSAWERAIKQVSADQLWSWTKDAASAMYDLAQQSLGAADQLLDMAQDTGVGADALDGIRFAAMLANEEFDAVSAPLGKLQKQVLEFSQGGGKAAAVFEELKISAHGSNGELRSSDEVLREMIDKLSKMEDRNKALGLAEKLAGEEGAKLIRVLNGHTLDQFTHAADAAGVSVRGLADASADAEANAAAWKLTMSTISNGLAAPFIEVENRIINAALRMDAVWDTLRSSPEELLRAGGYWNIYTEKIADAARKLEGFKAAAAGASESASQPGLPTPEPRTTPRSSSGRSSTGGGFDPNTFNLSGTVNAVGANDVAAFDFTAAIEGYHTDVEEYSQAIDTKIELDDKRAKHLKEIRDAENQARAEDMANRKAEYAQWMQDSMSSAMSIVSAVGQISSAIGESFDTTTVKGRKAASDWAAWSKALALFDIAMKTGQAIAGAVAAATETGPGAVALIPTLAAEVGAAIGAAVSVVAKPAPVFHGGTSRQGRMIGDEIDARLKQHEMVVDSPTVAANGGPRGVRDRLSGGGADQTFILRFNIGGEIIDLLARAVRMQDGRGAGAHSWNRRPA